MNNQAVTITRPEESMLRFDRTLGTSDFERDGNPPGLDVRAVWAAIVRERRLIILVVLLAIAAGVASILLVKPLYRAQATIQIDSQTPAILGTEMASPEASKTEADRTLQTQVDILQSRATAQSVAERLNLSASPAFLRDLKLQPGLSNNQVGDALKQRLTVSPPRDSRLISISYDSHEPVVAAAVANGFAEAFLTGSLQRRLDSFSYSRGFLQQQLGATKSRLANSERALISYARSAGLIDASDAAGAAATSGERRSLTTANLVDLNSAYSQARSARVQAEERWREASATPVMSLPEVLANPTIQNLTQRRAELQSTYEQSRQRYKDDHPSILQARAQLDEVNRQIATIAAGVRASIGDQYRVAQRQENSLRGNVGQLKSAAFAEQDKSVRYNILKREVDSSRNLYNALLQRFNEVSAQSGDTANTISIVDRAQVPTQPSYPRPALNMAIAVVAGLVLALLLVFLKSALDKKLHGPAEIERKFPLPLLGVVPLLSGRAEARRALVDPRSHLAEAHHSICLALDSAGLPPHAVLLLTSSQPNEGKSTTAVQLGSDLAATGKRVLLIDADMRRGSLHRLLGMRNTNGLSDLLTNGSSERAEDALLFSDTHGLAFLPRGRSRSSPAQLLASDSFAELLAQLRSIFDVVIIDGPPVMGLADAPRLATLADATLFLVAANHASGERVTTAINRLAAAGVQRIGMVLTKYDPRQDSASYGYGYRYDYGWDEDDCNDEPYVAAPVPSERSLELA